MSNWIKICALDDILPLGSRVVDLEEGPVAIFRTADDEVFALADSCPHKQGSCMAKVSPVRCIVGSLASKMVKPVPLMLAAPKLLRYKLKAVKFILKPVWHH